jgi:hypothetical protein
MTSSEQLFLNARQIADAAERSLFLQNACGTNDGLRAQVEKMLRDAQGADAFFESHSPTALAKPEGKQIGRYKLLEKIGEGGMGTVYMAEQREPVVRRVALKIIKAGMDTAQVVARFEAERQALALMDHPNIARVLDGGETGNGLPYFVMDLVQGLPITQFCDEAKLSTRERLELFLDVCAAIQHAHQKGIIHRDIKPRNILVTLHGDKPVPKVIDFGIAKATQQPLTDKTLFTQFQQFIGTPAYMSPEQASLSGLDIDTRSDIYALGVLLYELLTGKTPFDGKELLKAGLDEMRRTIREEEPLPPSTRLTQLGAGELKATARCRQVEVARLVALLRGDLDWIVMKAVEKDRSRRYETANSLATDIQRHLSCETVEARPPSAIYRFQKAIRRNKLAFAAGAAVAAALMIGLGVSVWSLLNEKEARGRAVAAEKRQRELRGEAEAARRKAEAGQTALLYWQAFDAIRGSSEEERNQLHTGIIDAPVTVAARYNHAFNLLYRAASIGAGCDWAVGVGDGPETWAPSFGVIRQLADAACLRAQIALNNGNPESARRDLLSVFILGRHAAVDGRLVTVMAQTEVESRIAEFVAQHFGNFPPETLTAFIDELRSAPARAGVARAMREERGSAQWLIREIQTAQFESEAKAILRVRDVLADWLGTDAEADQALADAGGTSSGMIAYISETQTSYDLLQRAAIATPADLKLETTKIAVAVEESDNLIVQRILPNVERARRREMEALARLAMLDAAGALLRAGHGGVQSVRDPFGNSPLQYLPAEAGFELRSALADFGYNGSLVFVTSRR